MEKEYLEAYSKTKEDSSLRTAELIECLNLMDLSEDEYQESLLISKRNTKSAIEMMANNRHLLINGRVQSGKTNSIISIISNLIEVEGYELVLYFTGKLNNLNDQNNSRFYKVFSKFPNKYYNKIIKNDSNLAVRDENNRVAIYSVIKYSSRYEGISDYVKKSGKKTLIINDEGDESSLTSKYLDMQKEMLINEGNKMITITATPFKNLEYYSEMYDGYLVLEHSSKYTGIDKFEYILVDDHSTEEMIKGSLSDWLIKIDETKRNSFLINIEIENDKQNDVQDIVDIVLEEMSEDDYFPKKDLVSQMIQWDCVSLMNGPNKEYFDLEERSNSKLPEIIIGGIKMSRGITFKNLTGELITVETIGKTSATQLLQKARWCGYRDAPNTYIYMNQKCMDSFEELVLLEEETMNIRNINEYKTMKLALNLEEVD